MNRNILFLVGLIIIAVVGYGIRSMVYSTTANLGAQVGSTVINPELIKAGPDAVMAQAQLNPQQSVLLGVVLRQMKQYDQGDRAVLRQAAAHNSVPSGELDLDNPTGQDLKFLFKLLKEGEADSQESAAKALVEIGDIAFVAPLFTHSAQAGRPGYFCSAALELLKKDKKGKALDRMVELNSNPRQQFHPSCKTGLDMRLLEMGGVNGEGYIPLLKSDSKRSLRFALSHIPTTGVVGARKLVIPLTQHPDSTVQHLATTWLAAAE